MKRQAEKGKELNLIKHCFEIVPLFLLDYLSPFMVKTFRHGTRNSVEISVCAQEPELNSSKDYVD